MADQAGNTGVTNPPGAGRSFRWRALAWGSAVVLWLLPLVAMQFTREMDWSPGDFVFFALMLGAVGGGMELAVRLHRNAAYRAGAAVALVAGFLLVWVNAAVGLIGDEGHPANLALLGVLVMGAVGALLARFRPGALARTLVLMALAQAAVMAGAWVLQLAEGLGPSAVATGFFVALWLLSAALFRRAARQMGGS